MKKIIRPTKKEILNKNKITFQAFLSLLVFSLLFPSLSFAEISDENLIGFDGIIKELSSGTRTKYKYKSSNPFDNILIHAGVALVNSHITIRPPQMKDISGFHKGVEASLGVDLFSRHWKAMGSVRSFGEELIKKNPVSLKEFDLKIIYEDYAEKNLKFSIGFGLAARYLDIKYTRPTSQNEIIISGEQPLSIHEKHTTPSSILSLGLHAYVSPSLSLGAELSYRSALISETIDKFAFDGVLKIETHF